MYETSSPLLRQDHASGMEHGHVQTPRSSPEAIWSLTTEPSQPWPRYRKVSPIRMIIGAEHENNSPLFVHYRRVWPCDGLSSMLRAGAMPPQTQYRRPGTITSMSTRDGFMPSLVRPICC